MKKFCAWCKHYQREKEPFDNPAETHGICHSCYVKFTFKFYIKYYWDKTKDFFKKLFKGDPRKKQVSWKYTFDYVASRQVPGRYIKVRKEVSDDQDRRGE